jgi:cytochrome c biogenesis protein ResB
LARPQSFTFGGRTYEIALRAVRYYKPYSITLLAFTHDIYAGTDIPKNFSSRIHLNDPTRGEDRDVPIYMNNPFRYHGETFYQASFEPSELGPSHERVTILQVVRNPASITPYVACSLIALGLVVQFLMHLFSFARKRDQQTKPPLNKRVPAAPVLEPIASNGRRSRL